MPTTTWRASWRSRACARPERINEEEHGATNWYFEDFDAGQDDRARHAHASAKKRSSPSRSQFDPQPFHVDREAAAQSIYGGVIASGWHTCSMMMRMVVDGLMAQSSSMGSPGLDGVRWLRPVRAGDTLNVRYLTARSRPRHRSPTAAWCGRSGGPSTSMARRSARSRAWACSAGART